MQTDIEKVEIVNRLDKLESKIKGIIERLDGMKPKLYLPHSQIQDDLIQEDLERLIKEEDQSAPDKFCQPKEVHEFIMKRDAAAKDQPTSIGEAEEPEDNRPDPGVLIPFKEYEKWMTTYSGLCDSLSRYFDDDEPKHVRLFQKATDSMILSASREPEPTSTEPTRPEIIPAEPLRVAPKDYDDGFYLARKRGGVAFFYGGSTYAESTLSSIPNWLERGLLFPATPEGEAGAELRAKQGLVPYPQKSNPAKIESLISEIEKLIFEVQTETEFRSEFDFMNEKLEAIRNEVVKAGHVAPAKALTEPLEVGDRYWVCGDDGDAISLEWDDDDNDSRWLGGGRIFPFNLRGKLGAAMYKVD